MNDDQLTANLAKFAFDKTEHYKHPIKLLII